ncbi:MAG: cell division protein FtsQ/DivIB [Pseudomonadota bacterium]
MRSLMLDPASRWGYRLQRIWLTPLLRALLRTGLPCLVIGVAVFAYLSQPKMQQAMAASILSVKASIQERPEFMLRLLSVEGASTQVTQAIRASVHIDFPVSSFDLDLDALKTRIEALAPIKSATLRIRPGGILEVAVIERAPAFVWRSRDGLSLVDIDGVVVAELAARAERSDLPLIAGKGADAQVPEALDLVRAAQPFKARLRGLRRMGDRRWDVILDRDQIIQLPEEDAVRALERVILLDQSQELLARHISHVDLRNPRRPTLRLAEGGVEELRRIKGLEFGVTGNE